VGLGDRDRVDERPGVGMAGIAPDRLDRAGLDDLAEVHDRDSLGELAHDPEVV
jgi:hypothetical protein